MRPQVWIIGILSVIALGIVVPMCDFLGIGTHMAHSFMPIAPVFLLFFYILVLNVILKAFKVALKPVELLFIFGMMTIACGFGPGCVQYLIPAIAAPFYFASPTNKFAETLHQYIPDWMVPKNPETIRKLYEGLAPGEKIPWKEWLGPVTWWTLLILAVSFVGFCIVLLIRKQWLENEKLTFPLVNVPIEMVKEEGPNGQLIPALFKNPVMWIAFAIPAVLYSFRGLHFYFPAVPDTNGMLMMHWFQFTEKPWNQLSNFFMQNVFATIGLTYFVPSAVSFSIWFFYLLFQFQIIIGAIMGLQMVPYPGETFTRAFQAYQVSGGIIVLAVLLFWSMRHTLADIFRKIAKGGATPEEKEEAGTYKFAFWGLIIGFAFICAWGVSAGMKLWTVLLYFLIFFAIVTVVSRLMAEAGLFYIGYKVFPFEFMLPFTGTQSVGGSGIMTSVIWNQGIQREYRVDTMGFFLNNMKMGETAKMNRKLLVSSMWVAILIGLPVAFFSVLSLMYKNGGVNVGGWWTTSVARDIVGRNAVRYITTPIKANVQDIITMVIGGGVTAFLFIMSRNFLWWPFHPIGYVMAGSYSICHLWWPTFLGWAAKTFVLRLGGLKIYQKLAPFFIGLVLGECVTIGGWVVVDLILGTRGNFLAWL